MYFMEKNKKIKRKTKKNKVCFHSKRRQNQNGYALVYWIIILLLLILVVVFWLGAGWLDKRMNSLENKQNIDELTKNRQSAVEGEERSSFSQESGSAGSQWDSYEEEETSQEETEEAAGANSASSATEQAAAGASTGTDPQAVSSTALNVTEESQSGTNADSQNSEESQKLFYLEEGIITSYYIKDEAITSDDIAERAITDKLLHSNAVTTRIIEDHTITKDDLAKDLEIKTSGDVEADGIIAADLTATNLAATSAVLTAVSTNSISIGGSDIGDIYLAKAGGTMTGALVLASDPGSALEAATKQYVDSQVASADTFLELTDTISTYNTGRILFETGSAVTDSGNLTFSSNILTTPDLRISSLGGSGSGNNVLVTDGSGNIDYQAIDSRVWGSSLIDGSGTANYVAVWSDGDTLTTGVLYDNGTNVGVGTTSVNAKLELNSGTSGVAGLRFTQMTNSSASIANPTSKVLSVDSDGDIILVDDDTGSGAMPSGTVDGQTIRYNGSSWVTSNTLFNNGTNVGVGTTNPLTILHVEGSSPFLTGKDTSGASDEKIWRIGFLDSDFRISTRSDSNLSEKMR